MTANYTLENIREHDHIRIPITISTDGDSILVPVSNVINHFSLGLRLVDITSDGGTNMSICKAILESSF